MEENIEIEHGFAFKGEFFTEYENKNILLTPGNFKIGGGFNYSKLKYYAGDLQAMVRRFRVPERGRQALPIQRWRDGGFGAGGRCRWGGGLAAFLRLQNF